MDATAHSQAPGSIEKVTSQRNICDQHHLMSVNRFEDETKQHEEALRRIRFKKEAKNLFSAPKSIRELGENNAMDSLSPPVRPTMKLIPSWESVLCALEARLHIEFLKLDKW